jgi:hypothetical protein
VRYALIAFLAAGCSQIFDLEVGAGPAPPDDAPAGADAVADASVTGCLATHDEDLDELFDDVDPCPYAFGGNDNDRDGDGIPDVCDPADGHQTLVYFESFGCALENWTLGAGWSRTEDSLEFSGVVRAAAGRNDALPSAKSTYVVTLMKLGGNGDQRQEVLLRTDVLNSVSCVVDNSAVQALAGHAELCTPRPACGRSKLQVLSGNPIPVVLTHISDSTKPYLECSFAQADPLMSMGLMPPEPSYLALEADSPITYDYIAVFQGE